jgi:hypothetical protein
MNFNGFVLALWAKRGTSSRLGRFLGCCGVEVTLDIWLALRFKADWTVATGLG